MTVLNNELANLGRNLKRKNVELIEAKEHLSKLIVEKDMLMRELNHRTKNNLSLISSILALQMNEISNEGLKKTLSQCRSRIHTIALFHQKLYQSENVSKVDIADFLESLGNDIMMISLADDGRISLKTRLDKTFFSTNRAVSVGLIVNELITNSIKHAFPGNRKGEISLTGTADSKRIYRLDVRDTGIGLPDDFDPLKYKSLGIRLINNLVSNLDGSISFSSINGAGFHIEVPVQEPNNDDQGGSDSTVTSS
jgi:two-component sensor histidine kinase